MSSSNERELSFGGSEVNKSGSEPTTQPWASPQKEGIKHVPSPPLGEGVSYNRHSYVRELPVQAPEVSGSYIRRLSTLVPDGYVSRPANFDGRDKDKVADTPQNDYGRNIRRVARYPLRHQVASYRDLADTNMKPLPMTPPWILHRAKASGFSFVRPSKPVVKGYYVENLRIRIPKAVGKAVFHGSFQTLRPIGHYLDYIHLGDEAEKMVLLSALAGVFDPDVMSGLDAIWAHYKAVFESPNLKVDGSCGSIMDILMRNSAGDVADGPLLKFSTLAEYYPQDLHVSYDIIDGEPHVVVALAY